MRRARRESPALQRISIDGLKYVAAEVITL
jgi:hypothetical protein